MKNNFNAVAPFYDAVARLVFGNKLKKIQQHYLTELPKEGNVLILGGGTGEILEWLPESQNLSVTYVELSAGMLKRAEKRQSNAAYTKFECKDFLAFDAEMVYDVVIANFFLDCFAEENLEGVILKIAGLLKQNGQLYVSDFQLSAKPKHRLLSRLMHAFFRLTTGLQSSKLRDIPNAIEQYGFCAINFTSSDEGQLFSAIYQQRRSI